MSCDCFDGSGNHKNVATSFAAKDSISKILKMIFLGIPALCMVITAPSFSKSMFGNLKLQIDHWIISLSHFKSATFIANSGAKIFS